jgi:hypothetical protein
MKQLNSAKIWGNQRGQGVTEYILLLVVLIAMFLGGLYQLNTAFEKWANSYFGDYLACLLETGDLPSIGGAPGDSGICNQLFEPFDLASGRPFKDSPGGGGGDSGDDDDSLSDDDGVPRRSQSGGDSGGVRETAGKGSYSSGGGSSFGSSGRFGGSSPGQNTSGNQKSRAKYTGSTASSMPAGVGYSQTNSNRGRPQYIAIAGRRIADIEDKDKAEASTSGSVKRDSGSSKSESRFQVKRTEVTKDHASNDEPWTFGSFLRFLIIAAIIIALVLFLGGQALQISKDSE